MVTSQALGLSPEHWAPPGHPSFPGLGGYRRSEDGGGQSRAAPAPWEGQAWQEPWEGQESPRTEPGVSELLLMPWVTSDKFLPLLRAQGPRQCRARLVPGLWKAFLP